MGLQGAHFGASNLRGSIVQVELWLPRKCAGVKASSLMHFRRRLKFKIQFRIKQMQELIWAIRAPVLTRSLSISSIPININGIDGICNPSITRFNGEWIIAARRANYKMSSSGVYTVKGGVRKLNSDTFIVRCDEKLNLGSVTKLDAFSASQAYQNARNGFEDPRLFELNGKLTGLWSAMSLGSGLVDHSQKMTVAARATAEKKTVGHRS